MSLWGAARGAGQDRRGPHSSALSGLVSVWTCGSPHSPGCVPARASLPPCHRWRNPTPSRCICSRCLSSVEPDFQTYGSSLLSVLTFPGAGPGVCAVDSHGSFSPNVLTLQHGGRGSGRVQPGAPTGGRPPPSSLLPQCLGALPAPHPPFPGPLVGPWGISCRTRVHRSTPRRQSHGGLGSSCTQPGSWTPGSWEIGPQCLSWNKGAPPGGSSVGPQEQAPDSSPAPMPEMPDITAPSSPESAARDCSPLGQRVPWGHCRSPCARAHLG